MGAQVIEIFQLLRRAILLVALGGIGGASKCLFHRLARGRPTERFSRSGQQGVIDLDRGAPLHAYILARSYVHKRVSPARGKLAAGQMPCGALHWVGSEVLARISSLSGLD